MNKIVVTLLSLVVITQACNNPSTKTEEMKTNDSVAFGQMLHEYHEGRMLLFPLEATVSGDNRYNDKLPNSISVEFRNKLMAFYTEYKLKLEAFDRNKLSSTDQMSYDVLKWECEVALEDLNVPK